jgi:hypothetical protein
MAYIIEVSKRDLSSNAEECLFKNEEGHNAEGTGEDCTGECKSLDGDTREIRDYGTEGYEYDDSDAEDHGSPVEWAVSYLGGKDFPGLNAPQITDGTATEREWLNGSEEHPYWDQFTEYHIYLTGDWTDVERGTVFTRVG